MPRTPAQIQTFLDDNAHRQDMSVQYLGTEPNAVRRPWDTATVRWCLMASWPYEAAAGNQSIPAVYKAIHDADPTFLCDRFYLPATPSDLRLLEKNHIPVFGIESKHQLTDFDVIATSISYPVLSMSFIKMLTMSGIPARWTERDPNTTPMVMVGGLSYGAPEVLSPVVDCWWLGEVEDEPGNPGIGAVTTRIAAFKQQGRWGTDRLSCYADLAREFNYLYFPRFVDVHYQYEDRSHVGVGPRMSKQVTGYTSNLPGMRLPFRKRHVRDLDAIAPLDNPPLLYADPAMGSGDLEVARGCPAWCSFCALTFRQKPYRQRSVDYVVDYAKNLQDNLGSTRMAPFSPDLPMHTQRRRLISELLANVSDEVDAASMRVDDFTADNTFILLQVHGGMDAVTLGVEGNSQRMRDLVGKGCLSGAEMVLIKGKGPTRIDGMSSEGRVEVASGSGIEAAYWRDSGVQDTVKVELGSGHTIECTADHKFLVVRGPVVWRQGKRKNGFGKRSALEREPQVWVRADELRPSDFVWVYYGQKIWGPVQGLSPLASRRFEVKCSACGGIGKSRGLCQPCYARLWRSGQLPTSYDKPPQLDLPPPPRVPTRLDPELAWILGFLIGDGSIGRDGLHFELSSKELEIKLRARYRRVFGAELGKATPGKGASWTIRHSSRYLVAWLEQEFGLSLKAKHFVPAPVMSSPGFVVSEFLSGLFDADGYVKHPGTAAATPGFTTAYPRLAKEVAALLLNLGAPSSCREMKRTSSSSKDSHLGDDRNSDWFVTLYMGPDVDWSWLTWSESTRVAGMRFADPHRTRRGRTLAEAGRFYTSVKRVQQVLPQPTFDLVVPTTHAFNTSGVVVHNTSDAEIREAVTRGIRSGIRKFKLFMISNLPGEDEGDVYRILKLAKDLADIRDSMGQSTVRIQFSWTPLMIEANTPFQWFAPQPANRILGDVWEDFRDLKIDFKIGAKAEPNKMAFFQLCQRASRDVGEALVDAMIEVDQACWGGVPRTFKDLIEAKLVDHGFQNGYADCFDERYKHDMFGWEFIDQGISNELLWATYVQMREFVEQTDSHTYDLNFGADYRGSEWLVRCNEKCYGKSCGACSYTDLKIRNQYIRAEAQDVDVDLASITTVDQHSQAVRIRAKITKPETLRFVGNDHWRFAFRRACFRAQTRLGLTHGIAKRSIRFASDETKYRDWTAGTDYVEFAFTRPVTDLEIAAFLRNADIALEGRMHIGGWARHPVDAVTIRADVDLTLFDVEIDVDLHTATQRLTAWANTEHVDMRLKIEGGYFAPNSEQVNAKDYVEDLWLLPDGHRLHLRMLIRGRPNPYNITAAVLGKQSWLPFAKHPARRVDVFIATDRHQQDFLRPVCTVCGLGIPINLLDQPYHHDYCPRCLDEKGRP